MNDGYVEQSIKTGTSGGLKVHIVANIIMALAGIPVALLFNLIIGFAMFAFGVAQVVKAAFGGNTGDYEYEYIMTNDEIDIAMIIRNENRKQLYNISGENVKFITRPDSIYLDNEKQKEGKIKERDFTSDLQDEDSNREKYVFVVTGKGIEFVYLELEDKCVEHINKYFKGKFKE